MPHRGRVNENSGAIADRKAITAWRTRLWLALRIGMSVRYRLVDESMGAETEQCHSARNPTYNRALACCPEGA
jgi:hypothetical protein